MAVERSMATWLAGLVIACAVAYPAVRLGILWHGSALEHPGVTVDLKNGQVLDGTLKRTLFGNYQIIGGDGRLTEFQTADMNRMSWKLPGSAAPFPWRMVLPALLFAACAIAWALWPFRAISTPVLEP